MLPSQYETQAPNNVMTVILGFIRDGTEMNFIKKTLSANPRDIAKSIVSSQMKSKDIVYLKWQWRYIMFIVRNIPEFIFKRINIK